METQKKGTKSFKLRALAATSSRGSSHQVLYRSVNLQERLNHGQSSICTAATSSCKISTLSLSSKVAKLGCERPKSLHEQADME